MTERFDLADLAAALEPERDERLEYMAMETLYQRYFLKTEQRGRTSNCPQAFWMRVAMGLALAEDDPQRRAEEFYGVLSKLEFTPSTPTLFHSGLARPQLSSCYLTTVEDDLEDLRRVQAPRTALEVERRPRQRLDEPPGRGVAHRVDRRRVDRCSPVPPHQ